MIFKRLMFKETIEDTIEKLRTGGSFFIGSGGCDLYEENNSPSVSEKSQNIPIIDPSIYYSFYDWSIGRDIGSKGLPSGFEI